jgi:chemotaxis protein CheX
MSAIATLTEPLVGEHITRALTEVFKIMLGRSIVPKGGARGSVAKSTPVGPTAIKSGIRVVVGQVGLVGQVNGFTYLHLEESFAKECVAAMLSLDAREFAALGAEAVKDAIGELANMTVGSFKNGLCDVGLLCKLTLPSVLSASDFTVAAPTRWAHRYHYPFDSHGHRVAVDVLLKIE